MSRYEYVRDTWNEQVLRTISVDNTAIVELKALNATANLSSGITATDAVISFDTLVGNYKEKGGVIEIGSEKIRYATITWATSTSGTFNGCIRGFLGTVASVHASPSSISYDEVMSEREEVCIVNMTGATLYIGFNESIDNTGNNAIPVANGAFLKLPLSSNVKVYAITDSATPGLVLIAELK